MKHEPASTKISGRHVRLTQSQRAILASHFAFPETGHQNPAMVIRFDPGIDPSRLARAFEKVVRATDILRLRILDASEFGAVVAPEPSAETLQDCKTEADFLAWARDRAGQPLDLSTACYESVVCRHPDGAVSWYMNLHHLINDGTSAGLVLDAVERAYSGEHVGAQIFFESWAEEQDEASAAYWASRLSAERIDRLYTHLTRSAAVARHARLDFDPELEAAWRAGFSGPYRLLLPGVARTAFLVAATACYLSRLSGADAFSIGVVVNHRSRSRTRSLIGPAFEVFPVDVAIHPDDTYQKLFERSAGALFTTLRHAKPGLAPDPDYDAVVNVLPDGVAPSDFAGVSCRMSWLDAGSIDGTHALRVMSTPYAECSDETQRPLGMPSIVLDYNATGLGDVAVEAAQSHMRSIVLAALTSPEARLDGTALTTPAETQALERAGTGPSSTRAPRALADRLRAALEDNEIVVLEQEDERVTGGELWQWANAIGHSLKHPAAGGKALRRVGIGLPPSIEAVAAIYGAILAGVGFVPLDLTQPEARTAALRRRAGLSRVFSDPKEVRAFRQNAALPALPIPAGDDEAYLLFTSGSTGEPKGVSICQDGLAAYVDHAVERYFEAPERAIAPLFGALTFDLTLTALFAVPLAGGRLIACPEPAALALTRIAAMRELTWVKATPSQLDLLLRDPSALKNVRTLIVGGEPFGRRLGRRLAERAPGVALINEYGPTEAVVGCMEYRATAADLERDGDIPIGCPIHGVRLLVMDRFGHPVPQGAIGELWISHPGIMKAYLDGPTEPFGIYAGRRFYRSGDLARVGPDGVFHYLGRHDTQLKINGVRLDPSEIEAAALSHPGIERAVAGIWSPRQRPARRRCRVCGLPDNVPGASYTDDDTCMSCVAYDGVRDAAQAWFRSPEDLRILLDAHRTSVQGNHDCLHLLSGGKDSTYALYRLVAMGANPYVLTLDNGYISTEARQNIDRVVADLGLAHEYAKPAAMTEIFRESLQRFSNVCHGCYKSIYVMATARAEALGIPVIVTGLSRGQLFETRLIPEQFQGDRFDPGKIDAAVISARRAYHSVQDACARLPEAAVFDDGSIFDRVQYVDFYRYVDVPMAEVLEFLATRTPWRRPSDTGRSTNCLINDTGIFTHLAEQGYHNYAVPYSWDVRLGHKTRDEAIAELEDDLDEGAAKEILATIGYEVSPRRILSLWYTGREDAPSPNELMEHLSARIPRYALPEGMSCVDEIPLTANGKVDISALPQPVRSLGPRTDFLVSAGDPLEAEIIAVWEEHLNVAPIGPRDDFFQLGGDSLSALGMIVALGRKLGLHLDDGLVFIRRTPRELAKAVRLAQRDAQPESDRPRLEPARWTEEDPPPLTSGEASLLFEQRRAPNSTRFNVGRIFWVEKELSAERLRDALVQTARRHTSLSWTYCAPRRPIPLAQAVDFEAWTEAKDEASARAILTAAARAPFDLDSGPVLRARLQAVAGERCAVLIGVHHVAFDYHSFHVFWKQALATYAGEQLPSERAPDPASLLQAAGTRDPDEAGIAWRNRRFREPGALLTTPTPVSVDVDGLISEPLTGTSAEVKSGHAQPLSFRAAAATELALLPYVTGGPVSIGLLTTLSGRPGGDAVVGYLLNPLPLQIGLTQDLSASEALERAAKHVSEALSLPYLHFADIVAQRAEAKLPIPRLHAFVSLIEDQPIEAGGLRATYEAVHQTEAVSDLTFFVDTGSSGPRVHLEYRRSRVADEVATALLCRFRDAIMALQSEDDLPVAARLPISESILHGPAAVDGPLLPVAISEHLARRRDTPALVVGDHSATWSDLAARVADIAAALTERGVSAGDLVAIMLPRGVNHVAAILAAHCLRAGYVPIDVASGERRIADILAVAGARLVLHDGTATIREATLKVRPDGVDNRAWSRDRVPPPTAPQGDDIAYLIFTSGTTGKPKGVAITQAQLAASTHARRSVYDTDPERFAMLSSFAFDSSIVGLFWTLCCGKTLILPTEEQAHSPDALARLLSDSRATHTLTVPTLYSVLLDEKKRQHLRSWPHQVVLAGETFAPSLARKHFANAADSRLTNEYGPTEATVWSLSHHLEPGDSEVCAGTPVPGTWVAIVGADDRPLPQGTIGELVIGGRLVANGYFAAKDADQARFGDAGLFGKPGERIYRTGDLACLRGGRIFYIGRQDEQLNVGGLRVEASDIESVFNDLPGVEATCVVATDPRTLSELMESASAEDLRAAFAASAQAEDPTIQVERFLRRASPAPPLLVAHLRCRGEVSDEALRQAARRHLQPALRPAHFVRHEKFPTTANGKIDRKALAALSVPSRADSQATSSAALFAPGRTPPRSDALEQIRAIFAREVGNAAYGNDVDFFDFGGHSLSALRVILEVEREFGVSLSTADIYAARTPRRLLEILAPAQTKANTSGPSAQDSKNLRSLVIPLQTEGTRPPIIALHNLGANAGRYRIFANELGPDQPLWGIGEISDIDMHGSWVSDTDAPTDVGEVARRYVPEIERLVPDGPFVLVGHCLGAVYAYETAQQLTRIGRQPVLLCMLSDLHAPEDGVKHDRPLRSQFKRRIQLLFKSGPYAYARLAFRSPLVVATWMGLFGHQLMRRAEKWALRRAKASGRPLSHRLAVRNFIETSFVSVLNYKYLPYDGTVLIVRWPYDHAAIPNSSRVSGWGDRLSDVEIQVVASNDTHHDVFQKLSAPILREKIDRILSAKR